MQQQRMLQNICALHQDEPTTRLFSASAKHPTILSKLIIPTL